MRGRSLIIIWMLLLCVFAGSCSKRSLETSEELITHDYDTIIYEEEALNEGIAMAEHNNLQEENNLSEHDNLQEENNLAVDDKQQEDSNISENEADQEDERRARDEEALAYTLNLAAGSVINTRDFTKEILDALFYIEELDQDIIGRITGKSYKEGADIPYSDLRYIRLLHMGFDGLTHIGELIVNKAIADDLIDIFRELYQIEYPIEKMLLIDEYDADDLKSMEDNNSSAFNFRLVEGTSRRSVHSDGLAIDINPLYNPYVRTRDGKLEILPESGTEHVDRDKENEYYIRKDDPCYKAFVSRGFTWGGEWKNSKDYQHFEKKISD